MSHFFHQGGQQGLAAFEDVVIGGVEIAGVPRVGNLAVLAGEIEQQGRLVRTLKLEDE